MSLLDDEEDALIDLVEEMTPAKLDFELYRAVHVRTIEFTGPNSTILTIALELTTWLKTNLHFAPDILARLVKTYPLHRSANKLAEAEARLRAVQVTQKKAGPPDQAVLASGFPVVDRIELRSHLAAIMTGQDLPVVVTEGPSGLGRTHSWNLIYHVASLAGRDSVKPILLDLVGPVLAQQTLPRLFDHLVRVLNLPPGVDPTIDGATPGTLSDRYVGEFLTRVQAMPAPWRVTPWLVFDHLDRQVAPEIKLFVKSLAEQRINNAFGGCVIFLLGPDPLLPFSDPFHIARRENLSDFVAREIEMAARGVNAQGQSPLVDPDLAAEVDALVALSVGRNGRDLATTVCEGLVKLRMKVRA